MESASVVQCIRILLVDDHPLMRSGLRAVLDECDDMLVVGEADDGEMAQESVRLLRPDVVVMDVLLPGAPGEEATQQIKAAFPSTKVLALTALECAAPLQRMLRAGASGVMLKRAAADQLAPAIRCIMQGGDYHDPSLPAGALSGAAANDAPGMGRALSEREVEVLKLLAAGHTAKEIGARLQISTRTLETYRARAMEKLALKTRAEIVRYAAHQGWLEAIAQGAL